MANVVSAGPFATKGERVAAEELKKLPASWIVICNKTLATADGRSYEIDFIVIGENWIFLLDEKSWKGKIIGNDQLWVRSDGSSENSPLAKIDYVAKLCAGHIRTNVYQLHHEQQHFVRGGVLLSAGSQFPQIKDFRIKDGIFLLSNVCQRLRNLDANGGSPLVMQNHGYIKKSLVDLSDRPEVPAHINNIFTIEEATTVRPGVRIFQATQIDAGTPCTLMVYDLGTNPLETQSLREFYMRELKALQELRSTGFVPDVQFPFPWSEDFLVMPIVPPPGKALSAYPFPGSRDELIQDLQIAADAFKALSCIHRNNVVHRAISPNALHILPGSQDHKVIFTDFFAARVGEKSIAVSLDALSLEDPYIAPELISGYGFAGPQSDIFSLTLVFLERWSAVPITTLRPNVATKVALPDLRVHWPSLPEDVINALTEMFQAILFPPFNTPRPLSAAIVQSIEDITRRLQVEMNIEEGKLLDNRYRVERVLGQGAMARTYRALDTLTNESFAVKRFLRTADYSQAKSEFNALFDLSHPNLPRIYHINPVEQDVHVIMEYIPGTLLSDVEQEFPWSIERWWSFAQGLLSAIELLEQKQKLHRDIKPANIILHELDNRPVLIDFGFATPQNIDKSAAGTPLYLPPEAYTALQPPSTSDRYAVAVVLFKVLTGYMPFGIAEDGYTRTVRMPVEVTDEQALRIAHVLLQALSPDPLKRPALADFRTRLQNAMRVLALDESMLVEESAGKEEINIWVEELRGLYRNSDIGNSNNRGLDSDFVRKTYVETALDKELLPALFQDRPKVVFLSGNPGDGKTAFLEKVQDELKRRGATCVRSDKSGWEYAYQEHTFRSCYDASESHKGQSADAQLTAKLAGLEGSSKPDIALTVLVAINDGRLDYFFDHYRTQFHWIADQLHSNQASQDAWVIDLKRRTFVNLPDNDELSIFQEVLERLVDEDQWSICEGCVAHSICPIRQNAQALTRARVATRLEYLLLLTHVSQQRHTTMRDLRSALAYLITGNRSCSDIHEARHQDDAGASLIEMSYWQATFASSEQNDALLHDFSRLDPARFANPRLDRFLHFHRTQADVEQRRKLFFDDSGDISPQRFLTEHEWMAAVKRKLYFDAGNKLESLSEEVTALPQLRWQSMLPYRYAELFVAILDGKADNALIREQLALGILRSDGITGMVPPGYFSVKVSASPEQQLVVLKQFPVRQFTLKVERPEHAAMIEMIPSIIKLVHHTGTPSLEIKLDLFELLIRMAYGLQPDTPEFNTLLEDLAVFKRALLLQEANDLVLVESNNSVHYLTQKDGKIVLSSSEERI
jgi:serine/threonine protein kinase